MTITATRRCEFCGYDLRGITSPLCPECGQSKTVSLRFDDSEHYHRARAALEQRRLLVSFVNAGLASEIVYATAKAAGWLRVGATDLERAITTLDESGVVWTEDGMTTVFREEPSCPTCSRDLRNETGPACPGCGGHFQWGEMVSTSAPDQEVVCHACFQDVVLIDGRCPRCGASETTAAEASNTCAPMHSQMFSPALRIALTAGLTIPVMCVLFSLGITQSLAWCLLSALAMSGALACHFLRKR